MSKYWINRAFSLLDHTLGNVPLELHDLDWKESLSANTNKLSQQITQVVALLFLVSMIKQQRLLGFYLNKQT
jgi:hypothetical protein